MRACVFIILNSVATLLYKNNYTVTQFICKNNYIRYFKLVKAAIHFLSIRVTFGMSENGNRYIYEGKVRVGST